MAVRKPLRCPHCLGVDFFELFRIEANADWPHEDIAVYACRDCDNEFDSLEAT